MSRPPIDLEKVPADALLETAAVARVLGVSISTVARMRSEGDGPTFVRFGRAVRYRCGDLRTFIGNITAQARALDELEAGTTTAADFGAAFEQYPVTVEDGVSSLLKERGRTHGDAAMTSECFSALRAVVERFRNETSQGLEYPLDMVTGKLARILCGDAREPDHWRDVEGYARMARELLAQ